MTNSEAKLKISKEGRLGGWYVMSLNQDNDFTTFGYPLAMRPANAAGQAVDAARPTEKNRGLPNFPQIGESLLRGYCFHAP